MLTILQYKSNLMTQFHVWSEEKVQVDQKVAGPLN